VILSGIAPLVSLRVKLSQQTVRDGGGTVTGAALPNKSVSETTSWARLFSGQTFWADSRIFGQMRFIRVTNPNTAHPMLKEGEKFQRHQKGEQQNSDQRD